MSSKPKKPLPVYWVVIIDVLAVGVSLCVFALFHHALPRVSDVEPVRISAAVIPTPAPATPVPTAAPISASEPTPEPTPTPTATPVVVPALSAKADASADPEAITLKSTIYNELKTTDSFSRTKTISVTEPFDYAIWKQSGVLTFRSGPFRQNAAYGTADVQQKELTEVWKVPMEGSIKASSSTLTGVDWPGQPLIVKWPTEIRRLMNLNEEKKDTTALKEVIVGSQNGFLYFLDLNDGTATREAIDLGYPSNGVLSVATNGTPVLALGQMYGNLAKKTVNNGLHLMNLLNGKELTLLNGKEKPAQSSYGGFRGAPLFDKTTSTMITAGQNGVLYTMELNENFDYLVGTLKIAPATQRYKSLAKGQKAKTTNVDAAVAMYGSYVYYADQYGVVQCVDVNTLQSIWAVNTGDNVDATPALDFEDDTQTLALYTGNTIVNDGKKGACVIRRLDGLTGKEVWSHTVEELVYDKAFSIGCEASPVVGQQSISDLVIFTVNGGTTGSTVIALKKADGSVAWTQQLATYTDSSPVAVYNEAGDAWLVQGESDGKLHLLDAKTGDIVNTLQLDGGIECSPAVYRDMLVIGTTGVDASYIYGIKLQ